MVMAADRERTLADAGRPVDEHGELTPVRHRSAAGVAVFDQRCDLL